MNEPRHYLTLIQSERGYSEKPEEDRPKDPMLWTVVKKDDYDELHKLFDIATQALEMIVKDGGAVCPEFMTCNHPECNASCHTWLIANDALRETTLRDEPTG